MVLTSGNVSDEPIVYRDIDAAERLSEIADAFLTHDRAIQVRTDDSVVRAFRGWAPRSSCRGAMWPGISDEQADVYAAEIDVSEAAVVDADAGPGLGNVLRSAGHGRAK